MSNTGWFSWWPGGMFRRRDQGPASSSSDLVRTWAEKSVTPDSAMQLSTAWACVRLNARTIGALPRKVYAGTKTGGVKVEVDHWLGSILHDSPNADQTAMEFWEGQTTALNLRGNAYAHKDLGTITGKLVGLTPYPTDDVRVYRDANGARRYKVTGSGSRYSDIGEDQMFHLRGFGAGGLTGLSPLEYGRQTMAAALAADESAARAFDGGLQLTGFIKMLQGVKLKEGQREELVELFDRYASSRRPGKIMPLDPGMEFQPLGMKPEDVQLLQTRQFHVEEICRWFGPPPILIGHAGPGQTMWGSGIEQIMLAWLVLSLGQELERIEQAIEKQLLPMDERGKFFVEHNVDALLRADSQGRAALMSVQAQNGLRTRNELRATENFRPMPGGDELTVQSNLMPLAKLGSASATGDQQARSAMQNWLLGGDVNTIIGDAVANAMKSHKALPAPPTDQVGKE